MNAFFIFPLVIFLTLAGLLFVAISYSRRDPEPKEVESAFLLQAYFFIALLISSFAAFWGTSLVIKAGLAYQFGMPFSYQGDIKHPGPRIAEPSSPETPPVPPDDEKTKIPPKPLDIIYREHTREKDILQGLMFLLFGLLFFIIHLRAFRYVTGNHIHAFLKKSYHLIGTLVYGGITLISIPMAFYTMLERILFKEIITAENLYRVQFPGELLGYAIPALVIWYLFFTHIKSPLKNKN